MTSKVDLYFDLIDQATMLHYDVLNVDYLEAFIKLTKAFNGEYDPKLSDEDIKKIEEIYLTLGQENFYNEEIRLALELIIIKAFKHINYRLNLMTPDTVNYLIAHIISKKFKDQDISILDTALGTANMLQAISNNFSNETKLIGIEDDLNLVKLAQASGNLQNNEIKIYYQDALKDVLDIVDIIIGDLDTYSLDEVKFDSPLYQSGVRYFPYLVIEARLKNLKEHGYFIYVIENDFFSQEKSNLFKHYIHNNATLLALIILPKTMFKENYVGKSILIGKKAVLSAYEMMILEIPSLEEDSLKKSLHKIDKMIETL